MNGRSMQTEYSVDKVERELLRGIISGLYRANDFMPSVERLCRNMGVGEHTMRGALGRLVSRGLLRTLPGDAKRVVDLQSCVDLRLLIEVIEESGDEPVRKWTLVTQMVGFMRFLLAEIGDRAALYRDDTQLEWMRHLLRSTADHVSMKSDRYQIGSFEMQFVRVLATCSGCVTHTAIVNSVRALFTSEILASGSEPIVPIDSYWKVMESIACRDAKSARALLDAAWWRVEERCLHELKKLGWTETPTGATPGEP